MKVKRQAKYLGHTALKMFFLASYTQFKCQLFRTPSQLPSTSCALPHHFSPACFSLTRCWPRITFIYSSLLANHTLLIFGFLKPKSMPNTQEDLNIFTWIARHNIYQSLKKKSRQSDGYMATPFGFKASLGVRNFCQAKLWSVVVKLLLRWNSNCSS